MAFCRQTKTQYECSSELATPWQGIYSFIPSIPDRMFKSQIETLEKCIPVDRRSPDVVFSPVIRLALYLKT
jgi:hypothetical protein